MMNKIDRLKVELYLEFLKAGHDNLTDSEIDIAFDLSKDNCIQKILENAIQKEMRK